MEPKYSILLCNEDLEEYMSKIEKWLNSGIKVIWFSTEEEVEILNEAFPDFKEYYLLQTFVINSKYEQIIVDGNDEEGFLGELEKNCIMFNAAQYRVEHCNSESHITVQASAGTGKTMVMIDRIMYLLHMNEDLKMSDIYMITFTNDATAQMNMRLQDVLMKRYELTKQVKYLRWVEEQSSMSISTIHSFANFMLKEYGINESFTSNMSLRNYKYEKRELVKDLIDKKTDMTKSVSKQLGVPYYKANQIITQFWNSFSQYGIAHEDLKDIDWGEALNSSSVPFQQTITDIIEKLDDEYFEIKRQNEAVSVNDIMCDLLKILREGDLPNPDLKIKYLFIDEFQDTDVSQINIACMLMLIFNAYLFVVGDVKQSIYRFRGANDRAFDYLDSVMAKLGKKSSKFTLVNNYRTCANILDVMGDYFHAWAKEDLIKYDASLIPLNTNQGDIRMIEGRSKEELPDQIVDIVNRRLNELVDRVKKSNKEPSEKDRVVILTRTNQELNNISALLKKYKIPASVKREGSFYASEAVRDFYMMISSYMFSDEPKYIFNYLNTPYATEFDEPIDINTLERLNADYDMLVEYLDHFLNQTSWKMYHRELRLFPVMSVLKRMVDAEGVIDRFIVNYKKRCFEDGWEEDRVNAATLTAARQYQANLEKLLGILQKNLGGDKVSIYDVYNFLNLAIATDRSETEAEVDSNDEYNSVLCMTVHKSKGLEFDSVIIPYTTRSFPAREHTEILIDPVTREVGWNFVDERKVDDERRLSSMRNDLYSELKEREVYRTKQEEVRILYVAMTRAIRTLTCIVPRPRTENCWAYLIREVGELDYE